jgi:methanogenic corrinoid protein MtbC1
MDKSIKELSLKKEKIAFDLMSKLDQKVIDETNLTYNKITEYIYYILEYIAASIELDEDRIIIDYLYWLKKMLKNNGIPEDFLERNLEGLNHMIFKHVRNKKIARILNKAINDLENNKSLTVNSEPSNYLMDEAQQYLDFVLSQKRESAYALIDELVNNQKISIHDLYYYIIERSQNEIGAMWERNEISVGDEHYASAFTQTIVSTLYPQIFKSDITKEKVLLMAIENESHELGIRMIADLFILDGWDAHYFGGDVPIDDILSVIRKNKPYMVVISATFSKNIVYVKQLIEKMKRKSIETKVFVGGYAFNRYPDLANKIKADYYTKDFREIIELANKIIKNEKK